MSAARLPSRLGIAVALTVFLGCMYSPSDTTTSSGNEVAAPVFSTDPCVKDEDCAPLAECHPARCVQAANAGSLPPGTVCTMECLPGTVDCGFNHCGCAASPSGGMVCALLPGPKPP
jgi:hypothetical protein